uniref:Peptidase M1 family protein n=1 Tax=Musa acuminata subsp. malaccensis TaxID=214687 RepID=A0A804IBX8_MUSAM
MRVSVEMARLVVPWKGSSLVKNGFLGVLSSFHLQHPLRFSTLSSPRNSYFTNNHDNCNLNIKGSYWCRGLLPSCSPSLKLSGKRFTSLVATQPVPAQSEESKMDMPREIFLKDYKMSDYLFDTVDLRFDLGEDKTIVSSKIAVLPRVEGALCPLVLHGSDLKLLSIKVDGKELKKEDFHLDHHHLTLPSPPASAFILEIVTEIYPQKNTSLEGLYKSSGNFCTQCEAEGFRKITFYQDRPDVMARYTCRIVADKTLYPVLLSNGNLIEQGDLEGGKHYALWEDPFKKPSYLFALVAGQLESRDDKFVTHSGREVKLRIWTPSEDVPKTGHAMYSLKAAMKWDEDVFGLEYDLDLFNIVAVPDFNMGAMENKSLNIFNSKLVLASPETATDGDYAAILGVIGHEYFHNWTGNRVTCRDWFQLSLKEGLTVFRDQEFSSDMGSRTVKRIADVSRLRNYQFPQKEEEFVFANIPERPIPSLLRDYSAPIRLDSDLTDSDLFFLLAHDSDEFNRWEAGQVLARKLMLSLVADFQQNKSLSLNPKFVEGIRRILCNTSLDKEFIAKAITLPGEGEIMDMMTVADPDAVHAVRVFIKKQISLNLKEDLLATVINNRSSETYVFDHHNMAQRALKNTSLAYLASLDDPELTELALHEYKSATNMTDQFAALAAIAQNAGQVRDDVLSDFYTKWQHDFLVVNKWFALQAMSDIPGNVINVQKLLSHPAFDLRNPNKAGILTNWRILWLTCEFPCKRWVRLQIFGRTSVTVGQD